MTDEQKQLVALMIKAGLTEAEAKQVLKIKVPTELRKVKLIKYDEYILMRVKRCKLCYTISTRFFYMKQEEGTNHLQSEEVSQEQADELGYKVKRTWVQCESCSSCRENLEYLTKSDVITLLLEKINNKEETYNVK